MDCDDAEALGLPWGAQVAKGVVEGPSRVPSRRERRRARNVTHTMVWRTSASETMGFLLYFAHAPTEPKLVQDRGAPNVTYTVVSWTWAPFLKPCHDWRLGVFVASVA